MLTVEIVTGDRTRDVDRYDEVRRAWIARRQGWSTIQRRRAERLGRRVRARQRDFAAAVADPHDDTLLPPLWLRMNRSAPAQVEAWGVLLGLVIAPLGWLLGWMGARVVTGLIPATLRSFPIAALVWSGVALGALIALAYDPAPSFVQIVVVPWVCVQLAAALFVAGLYGIMEGWLAIDGSDQWWPLTPPQEAMTTEEAIAVLGASDVTGPGVMGSRPLGEPGHRSAPW